MPFQERKQRKEGLFNTYLKVIFTSKYMQKTEIQERNTQHTFLFNNLSLVISRKNPPESRFNTSSTFTKIISMV